ncbi:MAG: hypothetical protein H6739_37135 [Alphaproteobacteria bacterium]|nr:hypothetical protein [Alphaproteobacteria bacterium]MCB9765459.1 hypothetical protein [Alphaproteobacteria bacterium]
MPQHATVARWSVLIDAQEASGQSVREFAESRGLNPSTLAWWRWKLERTRGRAAERSPFLELVVDEPTGTGVVLLEIRGLGVQVQVTRDTDLAWLREVLEALC